MKFVPIFVSENDCKLWSVCYPEHQVNGEDRDIFTLLLDRWSDMSYLRLFLMNNQFDLNDPFWNGMTITEAIKQIRAERENLDDELYSIETRQPGYGKVSLETIFKRLHTNIYSLNFKGEQFRKGKADFLRPMLRIYAIELDDGIYVITGGGIKLKRTMAGLEFRREFIRLDRVRDFLDQNGIINRQGLIEQ